MAAYLVRRFLLMLLTLFGISVIIFVLLRIVRGNIVDILFDAAGYVNPADKANLEAQLGLDDQSGGAREAFGKIVLVDGFPGRAADRGHGGVVEEPA